MAGGTMSIGEAARATGLPVKTIRYYEEIGLIPQPARTDGAARGRGHRVYGDEEIGRLRFIRHARLLGLSLAEIRELVALAEAGGCPSRQPEYRGILRRRLADIDEHVRHLLGLRAAIEGLLLPASDAGAQACSWDTCDCLRAPEPGSTSTAAVPEAREPREDTMCECCGTVEQRPTDRVRIRGRPLDVRVVEVAGPPKPGPERAAASEEAPPRAAAEAPVEPPARGA